MSLVLPHPVEETLQLPAGAELSPVLALDSLGNEPRERIDVDTAQLSSLAEKTRW